MRIDDNIENHTHSDTTLAETIRVLDRLVAWPLLPRIWVFDDHLRLNAEALANIGTYARAQNLPLQVAIVARSDLAYGLARLHLVYRTDDEKRFSLHRNYADALHWVEQAQD